MVAPTPVPDSAQPGFSPVAAALASPPAPAEGQISGPGTDPRPGQVLHNPGQVANKPGQVANNEDERIARLICRQGDQRDGLIEVLHQVQEIFGFLPKPALLQVARGLRLPLSRVYGVASFYHLFRLQPPAEHRCAVCLGTACFVRGAGRLAVGLQRRLGLDLDQTREDGRWALERVSCLGACGQAPVLVLDGVLFTAPPADQPQELDAWLTALGLPAAVRTP